MKKCLLVAVLAITCFCGIASAEDPYQQLATEISQAGESLGNKKLAIIPFSYADGRTAAKDGSIIAERLTMKMIKLQKFEIIERSVLDKVMAELKLQASGMIDASSAQQLGKVLGVDAIVTGTLVETSNGQIEVNARLIKTETAQAIGASQVQLDKNWIGDAATAQPQYQQPDYQQPAYQQPAYQPVAKAHSRAPRGKYQYGFFDVLGGFGSPKMRVTFTNSNNNESLYALGLKLSNGSNLTGLNSVKLGDFSTEGAGPIGIRVGGFGPGAVGGDFEFSYQTAHNKVQDTTWSINNGAAAAFTFDKADYITVKTFGMSGDLLFRIPGERIDPYFGLGLGVSLNAVDLPTVSGFTNSSAFRPPTNDFGIGFMFRIPIGMRIRIGDKTQIVTELRYELNTVHFDRGSVSGESDTVTTSGAKFLVGMGFDF